MRSEQSESGVLGSGNFFQPQPAWVPGCLHQPEEVVRISVSNLANHAINYIETERETDTCFCLAKCYSLLQAQYPRATPTAPPTPAYSTSHPQFPACTLGTRVPRH